MPLAARVVEPFRLGRKPLLPEDRDEGPKAERAVIHNAVLGAMLQLTSLIRHADDIFCDLTEECQKICEKTEKISRKIHHIEDLTKKLDSKKVEIPVGDLKKFSRVDDHHAAYHGYDCHMFTADSRPQCIKDQHTLADVTPAKVLRGADAYRKDGLYSSILFKLWPVFHNEAKVKSPDLSLNRKMPVVSFKKEYKKLKLRDRPKTIAVDSFNLDDHEQNDVAEGELTPTKTPSTVVIDTSGSAFHRMCSFRESLKSDKGRSKRRRTVSGATDHILQEIHTFEKEKRVPGRIQPRSYSFDDLDTEGEPKRDEVMAQYFDEIDAKYEEFLEQENLNKEPRYMKFLPCRRTRSLPRCVKPKHTTNETPRIGTATTSSYASSISLSRSVTSMASSRFSRATKRSSILGNKIKSIAQNISSNMSRSRPKSLDLDSLDFNAPEEQSSTKAQSTNNIPNAASMPDGIMSTASGSEKSIGPGTYYYFESNTLPKAQAKKYDFPWESLPKDWTTAVKLREISKRRPKEERQSSSGHWSASSYSNRHSVESGKSSMPSTYSAYSLGRDSGRDSPSFSDNRTGVSTYKEGNTSRDADTECEQTSKHDTDDWLKSLALRAASREDVTSSDANTLNSLSKLTRQNILALDMLSPDLKQPKLEDEFSEFSLDQDGFFTSFHTDSGLRQSNGNLAEEEDDLSPTKENLNIFGTGSTNTIDSVIFRPTSGPGQSLGPGKGTVLKRVSGKLPPPTPKRTCSISNVSVPISETTFEVGEGSLSVSDGSNSSLNISGKQRHDSSFSESDQETIYARLKSKTQISTSIAYPSWCSVSPSDSGEEIRESSKSQPESPEILEFDTILEEESEKVKSKCAHNHSGNTLPRTRKYLSKKNWDEETNDQSNSWPRSQKSGILKTEQSDSSKMSKTLNFDPVVNAYDSTNSESYQLTIPFMDDHSTSNQNSSTIPIKYQPTITVTPKGRQDESSRSSSQVVHYRKNRSTSTPTNHYAVSNLKGFPIRAPSEISASSLSISSLCENNGGYMDMSQGLNRGSNDNLSSTSSLALSDIDNSITYVSMSSPFSTPTNSTLTLNDNEVVSKISARPMDTYRVSSVLIAAAAGVELNDKDINSNSIKSESGTLKRERRNSKPKLTSQVSAPTNPISPSVVVVKNSQGHLPHSESWPSSFNSSTSTGQGHDTSVNSSRSDSYRVAMRTDANEFTNQPPCKSREVDQSSLKRKSTGSVKSTSSSPRQPVTPTTPEPDPNVIRADSYRIAVRKSNGVVAPFDAMGRATSYSVAVRDNVPGNDNPLARNSTSSVPDGKKDSRRRGITDIDQLKDYSGERKFSLKSAGNLFATINSSKKKMNVKSEVESLLRPGTTPSSESNRSSKSPKSPKSPKADKSKNKEHRSSTYIRFDPIFEDKEDLLSSSRNSLRTNSMTSINKSVSEGTGSCQKLNSENDLLLGGKLSQPLPVQRGSRSSLSGRKVVDDKSVTSLLDSIKSTIKSMSNKKGETESEMRLATDV